MTTIQILEMAVTTHVKRKLAMTAHQARVCRLVVMESRRVMRAVMTMIQTLKMAVMLHVKWKRVGPAQRPLICLHAPSCVVTPFSLGLKSATTATSIPMTAVTPSAKKKLAGNVALFAVLSVVTVWSEEMSNVTQCNQVLSHIAHLL